MDKKPPDDQHPISGCWPSATLSHNPMLVAFALFFSCLWWPSYDMSGGGDFTIVRKPVRTKISWIVWMYCPEFLSWWSVWLWRDNGITVKHTRIPVKEGNKLFGNDITKTICYELRLKSNKSKAINLIVEDQVPVSQIKDIRIAVKELNNANFNETTGLLKWDVTLDPKGYKALKFTYEITHNKDMPLSMYWSGLFEMLMAGDYLLR